MSRCDRRCVSWAPRRQIIRKGQFWSGPAGALFCCELNEQISKLLQHNRFRVSMSRKGNCYENSTPLWQIFCTNRLPVKGSKFLQAAESRTGLVKKLAKPPRRRDNPFRPHNRGLEPAPETPSPELEISLDLSTEGRTTSAQDRNRTALGPSLADTPLDKLFPETAQICAQARSRPFYSCDQVLSLKGVCF